MRKLIFFVSAACLFGAILACQDQGITPTSNRIFTKSSISNISTKQALTDSVISTPPDSVISAPPDSVISAPPDSVGIGHHRNRRGHQHHHHSW